jgi:hypothetical protein
MAPLSRFAVAVLAFAVVGVAAAPVPTQTSSSVTLQRRQGNFLQDFLDDMLLYWSEMGPVNGDAWQYKTDLDDGICIEKDIKGEDDPKCKEPRL